MLSRKAQDFMKEKLDFWDNLDESTQEYFFDRGNTVVYKKGAHIFNSDQQCVGMILVREGCLRAYIMSDEGREITLYRLYSSDVCILSASCIIENVTFDIYIDAQKESDVIVIPSSVLNHAMSKNIYVECFVYKKAVDRFSQVMWAMEQILFMSFDKRLAIFLAEEIKKEKSTTLLLTHEQIARFMGSAREVVTRMLKYFQSEGVIRLFRGGVEVIDKKRLEKFC